MADNSLVSAMLSGGNNQPGFLDPNLLAANSDIQLGQGMQQAGLSTAPASPAQGLARLAQALTGTYIHSSAISELGKAYADVPEEMAKSLEQKDPNNPLIDVLRSKSLPVQMAGMQAFPKVATLMGAPGDVPRGATRMTGVGPNPGPISPDATLAAEENKAAGTHMTPLQAARARAQAEATGTLGIPDQTPPAVQPRVPQNPPRIVRPPIPQTGAGASPSAAIPPPVTPDQRQAGINELAQQMKKPGASGVVNPTTTGMTPPPLTKDQVSSAASPPMTDQIAAAKGTQKAAEGLYGGASEALGKSIGEQIEAGGKVARDKMNALNSIQDALNAGGKGIRTGPYADKILKAKEALDGMGIDTSWVKSGLQESEVVSKMNAQLSAASAKAMTGRPTQFEFVSWMKNNPGLLTSKEGTTALLDILHQTAQQEIDIGKLAQNKKNWGNWSEVTDKYYNEHPLISPFTHKPMATAGSGSVAAAPAPMTEPASSTGGWAVRRVQPVQQ